MGAMEQKPAPPTTECEGIFCGGATVTVPAVRVTIGVPDTVPQTTVAAVVPVGAPDDLPATGTDGLLVVVAVILTATGSALLAATRRVRC